MVPTDLGLREVRTLVHSVQHVPPPHPPQAFFWCSPLRLNLPWNSPLPNTSP